MPAHSHDHYEGTIYGLAGTLTWTIDGYKVNLGPWQMLCIPRGAIHRFDNNTRDDVKVLCVITPAALGPEYFREAFAVLNTAAGGPPRSCKKCWRLCAGTASRQRRHPRRYDLPCKRIARVTKQKCGLAI